MQDVDDQTMLSFNGMDVELDAAGKARPATEEKGKGKAPVKFGDLPFVGGKKKEDGDDNDDDEEWKNFFLK